ncbi:hypothetical protein SKAU_G00346270 [Synaphobranchus kaupii]|uniref:Uncharacterized protein n=1 Tax=Synaphobranchus kaupii TaxID=118154 RepID=A0A9Q1EJG6_SYNKA|nr:hypothetical protein SKAU_G00346270 [Synaphobranchus kaupii]
MGRLAAGEEQEAERRPAAFNSLIATPRRSFLCRGSTFSTEPELSIALAATQPWHARFHFHRSCEDIPAARSPELSTSFSSA